MATSIVSFETKMLPTLVQAKRSEDAQIRREVVGQTFDYAPEYHVRRTMSPK